MTISWHDSYEGQLRKIVGHRKLICPSIRAIIRNETGQVLFVKDHRRWSLPAGSQELDESIEDTLRREVREETGLEVLSQTLIAVFSNPCYSGVTAYGDEYQTLSFVFRIDQWCGALLRKTEETIDAGFFDLDNLPHDDVTLPEHHRETLACLDQYAGTVLFR